MVKRKYQYYTILWRWKLDIKDNDWLPFLTKTEEGETVPIMFQYHHKAVAFTKEYPPTVEMKVTSLTINFESQS